MQSCDFMIKTLKGRKSATEIFQPGALHLGDKTLFFFFG